METLANRLRRLRSEKGLTVREMARFVGVAESTYREWENGRAIRGEPYMKLAKVFSVSLSHIMTGKEEPAYVQIEQALVAIEKMVRVIRAAI